MTKDEKRAGARRFLRFNAVGALGVTVQIALMVLLMRRAQLNYLAATAIAVEVSVLHNFVWHRNWTWGDRRDGRDSFHPQLLRFHATSGVASVAGNLALTWLLASVFGWNVFAANAVAIAVSGLVNYALADRYSFA